jgi:Fe-S-cluster containining protein
MSGQSSSVGAEAETVELSAGDPAREDLVTGEVVLKIGGQPAPFAITLPAGPSTTADILPILHGVGDFFAARGIAAVERDGRALSCRAGCGACCRQMVPIAWTEAMALAELVEAMPEPRRSTIRARFDAALAIVEAAGLLDGLRTGSSVSPEHAGLAYFRLGIACPFLEDEACSIYPNRPLACREYLVTSPARNCASPTRESIAMVPIEGHPARALLKVEPEHGWMALVLALRVAAQSPPATPDRSGPDILRSFIDALRD